jgi:hypothetical protein
MDPRVKPEDDEGEMKDDEGGMENDGGGMENEERWSGSSDRDAANDAREAVDSDRRIAANGESMQASQKGLPRASLTTKLDRLPMIVRGPICGSSSSSGSTRGSTSEQAI